MYSSHPKSLTSSAVTTYKSQVRLPSRTSSEDHSCAVTDLTFSPFTSSSQFHPMGYSGLHHIHQLPLNHQQIAPHQLPFPAAAVASFPHASASRRSSSVLCGLFSSRTAHPYPMNHNLTPYNRFRWHCRPRDRSLGLRWHLELLFSACNSHFYSLPRNSPHHLLLSSSKKGGISGTSAEEERSNG